MSIDLTPSLTFLGPDANSEIHAISPSTGQEVARFHISFSEDKTFTISRIFPSGSNVICIGTVSSSHGGLTTPSISLNLHGHELSVAHTSSGLSGSAWELHVSTGTLKWKDHMDDESGDMNILELKDANKAILARANLQTKNLDVFVVGDEEFLDMVVCSCVGVLSMKEKEKEKEKTSKGVEAFAQGMEAGGALVTLGVCRIM